ncbi:MAG: hypothetical protein AAFQ89_12335 [Cyanobacteria bacterium J06626_18]
MTAIRNPPPASPDFKINILAALIAVGIGTVLMRYWLDVRIYNQGESAYQQGNCNAAVPQFQKLAQAQRLHDFNDYQARSRSRLDECEAFLATTDATSSPPDQLLAYEAFNDRYDESPLIAVVQDQAADLVTATDAATLAVRPVCDRVEPLGQKGLVPAEAAPQLWFACGQRYENEADYEAAIAAYEQVLRSKAAPETVTQAETALAQVLVAQANAEGAGTISQPGWSGYTQTDATEVFVRNDSPERMRIVFSGPEPHFEEIAPCEDCRTYSLEGPEVCPNKGPTATFTLQPGDYEVLVRSVSDPTVSPFTGVWSLDTGEAYNSCFYLVQSPS